MFFFNFIFAFYLIKEYFMELKKRMAETFMRVREVVQKIIENWAGSYR